jgi:hypothetical protein
MSTSRSGSHWIDTGGVLRRLVHLVLLFGVIAGVRTCGGTASAEDELGAGTQWFAERTGLTAAKERWDKSIRPPIAAMTNAASDSFYRSMSRTLENGSMASDRAAGWIADTTNKAVDAVAVSLRSMFYPATPPPPATPSQQNSSPREAQRRPPTTP